jgi:hypothetical protein
VRLRRLVITPRIPCVIEEQAVPVQSLPFLISPEERSANLLELVSEHRKLIREGLVLHGGILFRGFSGVTVDTFRQLIVALSGGPLGYQESRRRGMRRRFLDKPSRGTQAVREHLRQLQPAPEHAQRRRGSRPRRQTGSDQPKPSGDATRPPWKIGASSSMS